MKTFPIGKRVFIPRAVEPELPPLGRQAVNFVRAVMTEGKSIIQGNSPTVPAEIAAERYAICKACEEYFRPSDGRCAHPKCGCKLNGDILAKTKLYGQKCPDKKWK